MRRRLIKSTLLIVCLCVFLLGLPLAILAREEVSASAHDQLEQQARIVAASLEDSVDAGRAITAAQLQRLVPDLRVRLVRGTGDTVNSGGQLQSGQPQASLSVSDATITVQRLHDHSASDLRNVTLVVVGLGVVTIAAAIGLASRQARQLAGPLSQLAERADALGRRDFSRSELRSGIPEIDEISGQLERSARQIGRLVQLQHDFSADAAHQLRTPLTGLALRLEEIAYLGDQSVQAEAEAALGQVDRLKLVITALLAHARGDSDPPTEFDLALLVQSECSLWRRVVDTRGRNLRTELSRSALVSARRPHVVSILTTLLDNAIEHGAGTISVSIRSDSSHVALAVSDEGAGIPDHLRGRVFDRTISGNRGTGIGLALARDLAEAEGAALEVLPAANAFVLTLPRLQTKAGA